MTYAQMLSTKYCQLINTTTGEIHSADAAHPAFEQIAEAIRTGQYDHAIDLMQPLKAIAKFADGRIEVTEDTVTYNGKEVHGAVVQRILDIFRQGYDSNYLEVITNFLDRLMKNPSKRSVDELYTFIEKWKLPLLPDGRFLTYKAVDSDGYDYHSHTNLHEAGKVISMPRNQVDDDSSRTCSHGLHVCSYDYSLFLSRSGAQIWLCAVDPADVVSIPKDYNDAKMRCCKYECIRMVDTVKPFEEAIYEDEEEEEEEEEDDYYS